MPSASTRAGPPTTMIPPPLPSESRFRLTCGWLRTWRTWAAPGSVYTTMAVPSKKNHTSLGTGCPDFATVVSQP